MDEFISREAVFALTKEIYVKEVNYRTRKIDPDEVRELPAAGVRPVVKAHWEWNPNGMDWGLGAWCCSECKSKAETWWANDKLYNPLRCSGGHFCGNCGADMREEAE